MNSNSSMYTDAKYQSTERVSFLERIEKNKQKAKKAMFGFLSIYSISFGFYSLSISIVLYSIYLSVVLDSVEENATQTDAVISSIFGDLFGLAIWVIPIGMVIGLLIGFIMVLKSNNNKSFTNKFLPKVGLYVLNHQTVATSEHKYILDSIEGLCIASGSSNIPTIYILDSHIPNAFAIGNKQGQGSIILTSALLNQLKGEELRGVIAHELSHIQNLDSYLMGSTLIIGGILLFIAELALLITYSMRGNRNDKGNILILLALAIVLLTNVFSKIALAFLKSILSQEREYLADASAVKLTRNPQALASALHKISMSNSEVNSAGLSKNAMKQLLDLEALFIVSPLNNLNSNKRKEYEKFNTHPPIDERIRRLLSM